MKKIIRLTEGDLVKLIKRVINEGKDKELEKLFELSKDDMELAKIVASGFNMTLEDLYEMKFGYLRGKEFNSCEEMDCEGNDFSFRINELEYILDRNRPFIFFDIEYTPDDNPETEGIIYSILRKYSEGVVYII